MWKRASIFSGLLFVLSIMSVVAQVSSCPQLVNEALEVVGDNCVNLARNTACYGYNQVEATFAEDVPLDYFVAPSDRASLTDLSTLRTYPMSSSEARWGVAVMNVQANLPNTVPGQGVIMMLIGDAEMRNDVAPAEANMIADPLSTVTLVDTNLHAAPSATSDVINALPANQIVLIDGFNVTREWLRVVNDGVIGWVARDQIARLASMDTLPIIGASNPSPMQAFYMSTGIGASECNEAEPMIAVQSPENIVVDLTVNGVDIRVGSLVTFKNQGLNTLNVTVHRGAVTTIYGNTINAGESAIGVINLDAEEGDTIVAWGEALPATEEDLQLGTRAQQGINRIAQSNGWAERNVEPQPPNTTSSGEIIHIVSSGETLYSIGRLYDASLPAIVNRNNLTPPYTLFSGDELVIPNPGSGFVGLPAQQVVVIEPSTDTEEEATTPSGCETLRLTSPTGAVPTEPFPYYWDGVAGATQYQINIFDSATGQLMGTRYTDGAETTITLSAGEFGVGGGMQWEVIALQNGNPICSTGLSQPLVHAPPAIDPQEDTKEFSVSWKCSGYYVLKVFWTDALDGEEIDFKVKVDGSIYKYSGDGKQGSFTVSGYSFTSVEAETEFGDTDKITGNLICG